MPLVGDLRAIVPQLVAALKGTAPVSAPELARWVRQDADKLAELAEIAPSGRTPIHPARFVVEATRAFPKDGIMVRDGGATVIFQWTYSQAKPHDVIWNQNFGHLGTGLPYAIGASVAEGRNRPVMLLTSDSAFLFHISELETAARLKLPLVCVVGVEQRCAVRQNCGRPRMSRRICRTRGGYLAGDPARLRKRQSLRCSCRDRSESKFRGNAKLSGVQDLVR